MKRVHNGGLQDRKRPKLQMSIRSMLINQGPKFTESVGLQPTCRYCGRMFKAAQGLSAHIFMHERAGDEILHDSKQVPGRVIQPALAAPVPSI